MKKIIEHTLLKVLKKVGFEAVDRKALELYIYGLEQYMVKYLKIIASTSKHSLKSKVTLTDTLYFINPRKISSLTIEPSNYEFEVPEEVVKFDSPLASNIEKYIHVYEFMPDFPPTHTFRQTIVKQSSKDNRPHNVKNRLEQSLRSEGNMLKLIKSSGTLPPFINYLYKNSQHQNL